MTAVALSSLKTGEEAIVVALQPPQGQQDHGLLLRLMEIGFLPGERLRVIARALPGGEPIAVRLGHATFALRGFEAALVGVEREAQAPCRP
ncbi:MAG: FeoA family protein [Stagnimonas sp.]|nr:FeoA family protein [Stagnimonas sp.]